jgi:hypothetical protein
VGKLTVILDGRGWLEVFNAMLLMWSQTTVSDTPVHAGVHHRDCRARRCRAGGGAAGPPRPVHARQDNRAAGGAAHAAVFTRVPQCEIVVTSQDQIEGHTSTFA